MKIIKIRIVSFVDHLKLQLIKKKKSEAQRDMAVAALGQLNVEEPPPAWGSRSVDCFERLEQIGEGTYGYFKKKKEKQSLFFFFYIYIFGVMCRF